MKAKIKHSLFAFLAMVASTFIIISSVAQWVPSIHQKTAQEIAYSMQLRTFLQNSTHLHHYLQKQGEEIEYEKN